MAATEKHSSAPQRGRHLCHLTSALSLQQDSVRLRRCGSRRHLRGRIALQANLSLQPTNPGLQPEVTHSIALQAKILLLHRWLRHGQRFAAVNIASHSGLLTV